MFCLMLERAVLERSVRNRGPSVEFAICPIVAVLEFLGSQACRTVNDVPRVVSIPVASHDSTFTFHLGKQPGAWIRCLNVKRRRGDPVLNRPVDSPFEDIGFILVHSENKTAVDH